MVTKIVEEWEVDVTITRTLVLPMEAGEQPDDVRKWLRTDGYKELRREFQRGMQFSMLPRDVEFDIDEIRVRETEAKSTDTDPRV